MKSVVFVAVSLSCFPAPFVSKVCTAGACPGPAVSLLQVQLQSANGDFAAYTAAYGREYSRGSAEHGERHKLFQQRVELIRLHNARTDRLWTAGLNHLTDRTEEELAQLKGWRNVAKGHRIKGSLALLEQAARRLPAAAAEVDWKDLQMRSHVPDQQQCGSCWAHAAATMLSARHEAQRGMSRNFSAQQLVNCVPNEHECGGQGGCQGSTVELAMEYVKAMGLSEESEVPYSGVFEQCTHALPSGHQALNAGRTIGMVDWEKLPVNRALPLMEHVNEGPVAVSVAADQWWMYSRGVFDSCAPGVVINHAVVLFGYGQENGVKYWNIRNSWGSLWGEDGFIRLKRGNAPSDDDAYCGTDTDPAAGVECKPYPKSVRVCGMCGVLYDSVAVHFEKL